MSQKILDKKPKVQTHPSDKHPYMKTSHQDSPLPPTAHTFELCQDKDDSGAVLEGNERLVMISK